MLAARTEAPREAAVLGLPPAEARPGAWRPAQEPGYSRCTSLSAEKVEEQLVTRAQGTPAAITASANRVPPGATSALGDTTVAGARGRRPRKARSQKALPPPPPPLPLPAWTRLGFAWRCHGDELPRRQVPESGDRAFLGRDRRRAVGMAQEKENEDPVGSILIQVGNGPLLTLSS